MNLGDWVQALAAAATVLLLLAAAGSDITRYRIPNVIVYAIVAAFFVGVAFNLSWPSIGWSVLAGVGMFMLGAGLFALRLFGGGDVKLAAAMALWTGLADLPRFLLVTTAAGGLLGVVWMIKRRRQQRALANAAPSPLNAPGFEAPGSEASPPDAPSVSKVPNRMPYGVAIAIAGLDFFITSAHSPFAPLWPWMS
jgi:prepilin peptidase CpaA